MEIDEKTYQEITRLSQEGNRLLDDEHDSVAARDIFSKALELLPKPSEQWEAYSWLEVSLGECDFVEQKYGEAYEHFRVAYNATAPNGNAFLLLRVGQCALELNLTHAQEFLLQAYMMAGKKIFSGEDKKYFAKIKPLVEKDHTSKKTYQTKQNKQIICKKRLAGADKELYEKDRAATSEYYQKKDWANYFAALEKAYFDIPEPRHEYAESFEFFIVAVPNALKYGYQKEALNWIAEIQDADLSRPDIGEREYYIGSIYYENELYNEAGKMFTIADEKSRGRVFMDKKYKKFYKEWKNSRKLFSL